MAKVCETADCTHEHQPLVSCNCSDNSHNGMCASHDANPADGEQANIEEFKEELPATE